MSTVVHPMGTRAVLIETANPLGLARAIAGGVEHGQLTGVIDIVPAATTVLVRFDSPQNVDVPTLASLPSQAPSGPVDQQVVTIPVLYDGADLPEVAEVSGMALEEVIAVHAAADYTVDFCGFAPGFGYLSGVPERLHVPRLASPRPRVPAGSVALAAGYTAVYPTESPGGWRLIGRTNLAMFDPHREPSSLLAPGMTVRFDPVQALTATEGAATHTPETGSPTWHILDGGPLTLIEDLGRPGHGAIALGPSGAFDHSALRLANRLVGNAESLPGLEVVGGGLSMRALHTTVLAAVGAGPRLRVDSSSISAGTPVTVLEGQIVDVLMPETGLRTTLALRGGIRSTAILGSCSSDTLSGVGPDPLTSGDIILLGEPSGAMVVDHVPMVGVPSELVLPVTPGPRSDWFGLPGWETLLDSLFTVSPRSDRIGVRLDGPTLDRLPAAQGRELPPEGMVKGAIQVPHGGQPVILGPDHPVTGGYPVIAVVDEGDVDVLAQALPGTTVRFAAQR